MVIIEVDPSASLPMMLGAKVSFLIAKSLPLPLFSDTKNKSYPLEYKEKAGQCPEGMYMSSCGEIVSHAQTAEFPKAYQIHMQKPRAFIQAPSWTLCVFDTELRDWRALSSVGVGFFFFYHGRGYDEEISEVQDP